MDDLIRDLRVATILPRQSSTNVHEVSSRLRMNPLRRLVQQLPSPWRSLCPRCQRRLLSTFTTPSSSPAWIQPSPTRVPHRNAGSKLRKALEDLPQGLQAPIEPFIEREAPKYSQVLDEVLQNQRRFPKCILLTRVGQFYEVHTLGMPS